MKKQVILYLWAVVCLGVFSGALMSMGTHMLMAIGFMCAFWACMLMPMLAD
jgi:hypothetical protein